MARKNRIWVLLCAVLVAVGASGYLAGFLPSGSAETENAEPPLIVTIGYGDIENAIPAAGTIIARREGGTPAAGPAAPASVASDRLAVDTEVYEGQIGAVDDAVEIYFTTLETGERRWYGSDLRVNPVPDTSSGVAFFSVRFDVDDSGGELATGMTAQVFFITSSARNVLTVPVGALTLGARDGDTRHATVEAVLPDGEIERREIVVRAMDRVNAEVMVGLAPGDRVVAGTILPPAEISERSGDFRRDRARYEERFFEPEPEPGAP
jgi:macrolide-specific efflux system membrane fusion protein